jgi:hypothetical protein
MGRLATTACEAVCRQKHTRKSHAMNPYTEGEMHGLMYQLLGDPHMAMRVAALNVGPTTCCYADVDGNGWVNIDDLFAVILTWGPCQGCATDIHRMLGNGVVNIDDLLAVVNAWGQCP